MKTAMVDIITYALAHYPDCGAEYDVEVVGKGQISCLVCSCGLMWDSKTIKDKECLFRDIKPRLTYESEYHPHRARQFHRSSLSLTKGYA